MLFGAGNDGSIVVALTGIELILVVVAAAGVIAVTVVIAAVDLELSVVAIVQDVFCASTLETG